MHDDPILTAILAVLTLLSAAAFLLSLRGLFGKTRPARSLSLARWSTGLCALGSGSLFVHAAVFIHGDWRPLQSHVDGLLLVAAMLGATIVYLQSPSRLPGISTFALPVLTFVLAWAICASRWTYFRFETKAGTMASVWQTVHLLGVYAGTLFVSIAAVAGGMYLYVQHRLRRKRDSGAGPMASLETIERWIIHTSAAGFAMLTLGVASGIVIALSGPTVMGPHWWYSVKFVLSFIVWLIYALLMNVRHATAFRGRRAAWLSVAGLVLLLATFGIAVSLAMHAEHPSPDSAPAAAVEDR